MTVAVLGAGAFGTALAVALAREGRTVALWARSGAGAIAQARSAPRLPGVTLPPSVQVTGDLATAARAETLLLAVPMQQLEGFLADNAGALAGRVLVACCKGVDLASGRGPMQVLADICPSDRAALLTGPGFAADLARGLPTALTLACADAALGRALQTRLSTPALRLYRTTDTIGAELGGALKNVIAIAAGFVIGAGLGDSARAALMTRGYAEMKRFATARGARAQTLAGLSGFGDLVLTCTSDGSRNFRHGRALGAGEMGVGQTTDPGATVEGVATARAVAALARDIGIDMPITTMVAAVLDRQLTLTEATDALMTRPLKEE
jgi:glycerol-3-phosphate dehydrogenase (NAD(P)+)